ncbi:MAG TPA: caspase family protein, partial [Spirochaetia bacterium]|nr:caspase family protein [Spirochaetia bacterium]
FISPDGKYIAGISRRYPNLVRLWDLVGRPLKTLEMPAGAISAISFSPDGKSLAGGSFDGRISKWNIESGDHMSLLGIGDEWIMFSPDGYFDSSRRGGELVSMVRGLSAFGPDQFALRYNRPDLVLKRLDFPRDETIRHFYLQYIKRLVKFRILPNRIRKPVFEEAILSALSNREDRQFLLSIYQSQDEYYAPVKEPSLRDRYRLFSLSPFLEYVERDLGREMHVPEAEFLEVRQQGKFVDLDFRLTDTRFELLSYNVYMNDVPLFGSSGKPISGSKLILSERVELAAGINKIEVGCVNDRLAESFREQRFAEYNGSVKPDLYFVGFGVSKYKNPDLNLVYPHKDVKDLRSLFSGMKGYFDSIYAYDFVDEKCTTSSIRKVKKLLADASVDDTVVLFISGHGMHSRDPEAVYYFLIHEADIDNLGQTAADFDLIEDILDGVKPRYKLFLMDTCESGELDEELAQVYLKDAEEMGLRARTPKGVSVPAKGVGTKPRRAYLMERDRYIYNDVFRRTGAIVFSSSRGGEYSYEPGSYEEEENGFFTGAIIKSIKDNRADRDKDGFVTTDEMREYVSRAVKERTNGLQNPTVDRDNLYLKFGFPSAD